MFHVSRLISRRSAHLVALAAAVTVGAPALSAQQTLQTRTATSGQAAAAGPVLQLSMEQAAQMALESNLGLKAEKLNVDVAAHGIAISEAAFLPIVTFGASRNSRQSPPQSFADGTQSVASSQTWSGNGTVAQNLRWYGGQYQLTWSGQRFETLGGQALPNPSLGSIFRVQFTQPLWRDRTIDNERAGLETSERRRAIADVALEQQVIATDVAARLAYLNLVGARERLNVAQQNLDIRQKSLEQAKARVAVGASAQIAVIQAEADVASNLEQVIVAQAGISAAEDDLRTIILDPSRPDYWQVRLEPTDTIQMAPREIDLDAAIKNALANRLDLVIARRNLEITDLNLKVGENNIKPSIDAGVNYSSSGSGGLYRLTNDIRQVGFGSVLGDAFGAAYPDWTVGVTVGYPIGNTAAKAGLAQGQVQKRRQELTLRESELEVVRQVREAARQVQNSRERVQATQAALTATEQQMTAEERSFAVGLSTTLDVQIRQSQLATARVNELNARIDYNRALINFERVQRTQ